MSKLTKLDFYGGAGLAILFRKNEHISPSIIENVNDIEGKNVVGIFYQIKTQTGYNAIIYIKFSSNQQTIKNLSKSWKFSLTEIEKDKINKQVKKNIPFFMILVCVDQINRDNVFGEIALLTLHDYKKIFHRSNIIIGLWSDEVDATKTERQKVYVLKVGKGNSRDYYCSIKRNQIEIPIENLIQKYYPQYIKTPSIISSCEIKTEIDILKPIEKIEICVSDNPKICSQCHSVCAYELIKYLKANETEHKINVASCPTCNKKYIHSNFYKTFIKNNENTNISFNILNENKIDEDISVINKPVSGQIIRCLLINYRDDNICPIHNTEMSSIYVHIDKIKDTAYYCNKCGKFMIPSKRYMQLIQTLGKKSTRIEFEAIMER